MGYYISHTFGIRVGGVFSGRLTDEGLADCKQRIAAIVLAMRAENLTIDMGGADGDISHCLSTELEAHKGSYLAIAGVYNYFNFDDGEEFAKRLSAEFQTEVMHMAWNEATDEVNCQVWLAGRPLFEVAENPIGRTLRRVTGK